MRKFMLFVFACCLSWGLTGCSDSGRSGSNRKHDDQAQQETKPQAEYQYQWEIIDPHGEGCVSCGKLIVLRTDPETGRKVEGTGRTLHCYDRQGTPTRFMGYEFVVDGKTYRVTGNKSNRVKIKPAPVQADRRPSASPRDFLSVQVIVALCDNENQGIVPVAAALGNGQDQKKNLYWGAMYGVKSFFKRSRHWKHIKGKNACSIRRLDDVRFEYVPAEGKKVVLQAWAIDGADMRYALQLFFNSVQSGKHDLIVFVGHNGLMDTALPELTNRKSTTPSIILCCQSDRYFRPSIANRSGPLLLSTFGNMAPEAYTLDAAVRTWANGGDEQKIRASAAAAYAKYQKCSITAANRLFGAQ